MNFWQEVLKTVQNQKIKSQKWPSKEKKNTHCGTTRSSKRAQYHLAPPYEHIHLTEREAQCIYHLLQGSTMKTAAASLELSPRTVEFYVNNIKDRIGIRKKKELLSTLEKNQFLKTFYQSETTEGTRH